MQEGNNNRIVVLVIVLLVVAFFAYGLFFTSSSDSSEGVVTTSTSGITQEVSVLLADLKSIHFSEGVFTNPKFTRLSDFSLTLIPFPAGRTNPFAPLGF